MPARTERRRLVWSASPIARYGVRKPDGWTWYTYRQIGDMVDAFRAALAELGVERGDRVACVSNNRIEWVIAWLATDSGAKVCLAGSADDE